MAKTPYNKLNSSPAKTANSKSRDERHAETVNDTVFEAEQQHRLSDKR